MMGAVVENKHVPVVQVGGIVLMGNFPRPPLPGEFPAYTVNDAHGAGLPEADQQVPVFGHVQRVLVGPLIPVFQEADHVLFDVQVFPRTPAIHRFSLGSHLVYHVPQHGLRCIFGLDAALDLGGQLGGHLLKLQHQSVAVGQPLKVVVHHGVAVGPHQVAVPIQLDYRPHGGPGAPRRLVCSPRVGPVGSRQQVSII